MVMLPDLLGQDVAMLPDLSGQDVYCVHFASFVLTVSCNVARFVSQVAFTLYVTISVRIICQLIPYLSGQDDTFMPGLSGYDVAFSQICHNRM